MAEERETNRWLTRDEVIVRLHDHRGQAIEVSIEVELGDYSTSVLAAHGTLFHWHETEPAGVDAARIWGEAGRSREDIIGLYSVGKGQDDPASGHGDASLDISGLEGFPCYWHDHEVELLVELAENVRLRIVALEERDA